MEKKRSFAAIVGHPCSVMAWGGIDPNGFRTPLLQCPDRMTSILYVRVLADNHVLLQVGQSVPDFV